MLKKVISTIMATIVCFLALPIGDLVAYAADDTSTYSYTEMTKYTVDFVSKITGDKGIEGSVPLLNGTGSYFTLKSPSNDYFLTDTGADGKEGNDAIFYNKTGSDGSICVKINNTVYPVEYEPYDGKHIKDNQDGSFSPFYYKDGDRKVSVDTVSLLYFINKVHTLYHYRDTWTQLGGWNSDTIDKLMRTIGNEATFSNKRFSTRCTNFNCPIMRYMTMHSKKTTDGKDIDKPICCSSLFANNNTYNDNYLIVGTIYSMRSINAKLRNFYVGYKDGRRMPQYPTYDSNNLYETALIFCNTLDTNASAALKEVDDALDKTTDVIFEDSAEATWHKDIQRISLVSKEVFEADIKQHSSSAYVSFDKVLFYYLDVKCDYASTRLKSSIPGTASLMTDKSCIGYYTESVLNMLTPFEDFECYVGHVQDTDIKWWEWMIPVYKYVKAADAISTAACDKDLYEAVNKSYCFSLRTAIKAYEQYGAIKLKIDQTAKDAINFVNAIACSDTLTGLSDKFPGYTSILIPYIIYRESNGSGTIAINEVSALASQFYDNYKLVIKEGLKGKDKDPELQRISSETNCVNAFKEAFSYFKSNSYEFYQSLYKGWATWLEQHPTEKNTEKFWKYFTRGERYQFLDGSSYKDLGSFKTAMAGDVADNYNTKENKWVANLNSYLAGANESLHLKYYYLLKEKGVQANLGVVPRVTLVKPGTVVLEHTRDELYAAYKAAKETSVGGMGQTAYTLKARADLLDLYAEYGLEEDDIIKEVIEETIANTTDEEGKRYPVYLEWYSSRSLNFTKSHKYFYYQLLLVSECDRYAANIIFLLSAGILGDSATSYEGLSNEIKMLENVQDVINRYPTPYGNDIWNLALGGKGGTYAEQYKEKYGVECKLSLNFVYQHYLQAGLLGNITTDYDIFTKDEPLSILWTLTGGNILFDSDYYTGRALSATYIPMQDNLYDPYSMMDYVEPKFIEDFHYKYGFYRKALFIGTSPDTAVDYYTSGVTSETRLATLKDILNPAKDIVLYVDTNFYNLTELAEAQDKAYDRLANDPNVWRDMWTSFTSLLGFMNEVDFDIIMKHGANTMYSEEVAANNSGLTYTPPEPGEETGKSYWNNDTFYDDIIMDKDQINSWLSKTEYSPMKGYAIVSTIYRDPTNYNKIAEICAARKPVFVSSPTLWTLTGIDDTTRECLYNYALLKNLSAMTTVGYDTSLDMTSPLYIDVYGNISTESGTVVIPAAANATLHANAVTPYQPINTGFLSTYGKEWSIPLDTAVPEEWMEKFFVKNEEEGVWDIAAKTIRGVPMNFAQLSYSDVATNIAIMNWYKSDIVNGKMMDKDISLNIVHEVMRGAPLEFIDADEEGLNPNRDISKQGLVAAAKLDQFINSLNWDDDNSITGMPNLSFIPNYQYVVTFVFKVLLVIIVIALMVTVYIDAVRQTISGRTILKCVSTLLVGVGSVLLIPTAFEISYYQSNKLLLQDEAGYIMLMNTEKNMSGREIGITEVTEPEQNTKIYIKLENYDFDWISVLPDVIFGDSVAALDEAYNEFLESSLIAGMDNVQAMNDGMYMDVQDIFDTSVVNFDTHSKSIYQKVSVDPVASYYLPYYYFLDALITNINDYNVSHNVYAYSTKIMRGGYVKTINLCDAYFNSPTFMDNEGDTLGLRQLYDLQGSVYIAPIFSEEAVDQARGSQWYTGTYIDSANLEKRVNIMHDKVRRWVSENRDVIGRITDESFLKVLAMEMAVEYNNLFGMPNATAYEIYDLSNADLMRLVVCDKETTLEDSPMSFARFVYNEAGTPGVIAGIFLTVITLFTSFMRTILTIAIMVLLIVSVYVFKILLRKSNNSVAGYLATLGVICATNVLYAVVLKISIAIPSTGLAPTICIILQILIQLAYLVVLGAVLIFAIRDWRNFGYNQYQMVGTGIKNKFQSWRHKNGHGGGGYNPADDRPRGVNGWDYLNKLEDNFKKKQKKVGR